MTADGKYFLLNKEILTQPIQILLSQKEKTFSHSFFAFHKSALNFEHFKKQDDPHSRELSEITDSEKGDEINA